MGRAVRVSRLATAYGAIACDTAWCGCAQVNVFEMLSSRRRRRGYRILSRLLEGICAKRWHHRRTCGLVRANALRQWGSYGAHVDVCRKIDDASARSQHRLGSRPMHNFMAA